MTCLWPLFGDPPADWSALPDPVQVTARELASRTLERLCGGRVGMCSVTIEVCRRLHSVNCGLSLQPYALYPINWGGRWSDAGMCTDQCDLHCEVEVPGPIGRVDQVKVNGTVLDPSVYRVVNTNLIEWTGTGDCPFPPYGPGIQVTYLNAYLPGPAGEYACTVLAYEYGKAISGKPCRLPTGVTNVARQGITMTIPSGAFPDGRTGIREVDAYVMLWNPHGIDPPQVWSPDLQVNRRIGG